MEKGLIKSDSTYNKMNYFMGIMLLAFIIFLASYFAFLYRNNNKTACVQQNENVISAARDITNLKVTTIG